MADPWAVQSVAEVDPWSVAAVEPVAARGKPKRSGWDEAAGFMANVNRGLGIGDEMAAGAMTAGNVITGKTRLQDIPDDFRASMKTQRGIEDSYAEDRPLVAAAARGTGNALTMAAPVGPGAQAFAQGSRVGNALRGATVAGLSGAGYAAVDRGTVSERGSAAARAAYDPVTLGLGAGAGAIAAGRPRAQREEAPTLEQLQGQRDAAYNEVRRSGHQFDAEAFGGLTEDMARALDAEGFNAGLHPKTAAMLERIGQSNRGAGGYSPTLNELDQLRQQIGRDVAASPDPGERRMGTIMRRQIDEFIDAQGQGSDTIRRARDLNTRVEKIRTLDNLDEAATDRAAATGSGGNVNNATRQNAIRFKNKVDNLTPDEEAATQRVIDGTPVGNALRQVGKLSPTGNGLMLAGHIAAAAPTHGVSAAIGLTGAISKAASDAITARNVQALRELIARGGREGAQEVERQLISAGADDLRSQLANDLAVAAGVQGASRRGAVEVTVEGHPEYGVGTSSR